MRTGIDKGADMADSQSNRGKLRQSEGSAHADESRKKRDEKSRKRPSPVLVAVVLLVLGAIGAGGWVIVSNLNRPSTKVSHPSQPAETEKPESSGTEGGSGTSETSSQDAPETSVTTTPLEPEGDAGTTKKEDAPDAQKQLSPEEIAAQETEAKETNRQMRSEVNAIVADAMAKAERGEAPEPLGSLDRNRMQDVIKKFAAEWFSMANDRRWDAHSPALRALMAQDYVKEHQDDPHVHLLWECMANTLYLNYGSKQYTGLQNLQIVNSVPSPLTYALITMNYNTMIAERAPEQGTECIKIALNRDYQVCQFYHISS